MLYLSVYYFVYMSVEYICCNVYMFVQGVFIGHVYMLYVVLYVKKKKKNLFCRVLRFHN